MLPLEYSLFGGIALFVIGLYCLVAKRNMIRLLIGVEVVLNAANLNFITFSAYRLEGYVDPTAHAMVIISIVAGACIVAVGLTIVTCAYRHFETLDARRLRRLRW
ncbi:TPA: NADH-quinone oxidoreductase subunit NuoK [Candidatus Bathyarchaeota archaeon]|nr:NADH-quinone oxidoreductase subunit NuoK [Candidatus Bathyarchaeota archaeon]